MLCASQVDPEFLSLTIKPLLNKSEHSDGLRDPRLFLPWLGAWSFLKNPANDQMD
jgi:hypothetical protein